ncbi:hypothetical protein EDF56_101255 [Novosphingobium sp. PhB165]|uniref:hypothetical protein n=1 Tax=Novosphingobium sp. PhB165 TaxID=2485105 RepID=UPI0010D22892|nr:hypothetical protein [Novosphingobium sp. PhB165]TCM21589.1 hypothetical protein EDF56_101255 [Novosphingobium sp. PhB165]
MISTERRNPARGLLAGLAVAGMAMLVAACIFVPGKFTSQLSLKADRSFHFAYTGEIVMLPLQKSKETPFEPETCYDDNSDERACTPAELAEQKSKWEESRADKQKTDAQAAKALLGGIDPSDPRAGEEVAAKLRRQTGWNNVVYKGDGRFDVDFAIGGKLDHDFTFPTIEGFPMANAFVQLSLRQDGSVRIDAPAFGPSQSSGNMMGAMLAGMNSDAGSEAADTDSTSEADGTFSIVTNGEILANNTDEGPQNGPGGRVLTWKVNARTPAAPTALVKLKP